MANKHATLEVRQGDTFLENLIMEDTATGTGFDLTGSTVTAVVMFPNQNINLDVSISTATDGSFSISKSATDTASWPLQDGEGYITITNDATSVKTSSDNFAIRVVQGAV